MSTDLVKIVDKSVRDALGSGPPRSHLGASQVGGRCPRKAWYAFRWAYQQKHTGRILRLFERGNEEEFRFVKYLRTAGFEVRDYSQRLMYHDGSDSYLCIDWEDADNRAWLECDDVSESRWHIERATARDEGPKQYGFRGEGIMSHFAGSSDGQIHGGHILPDGWGGLEFKTHNDKSFKALESKGVLSAKPEHWVQTQVYMHRLKLPWTLYFAVNKNDDNLYPEIIKYKSEIGLQYDDIAEKTISAKQAPKRLSDDPSWWECKFCEFREICHYEEPPQKNCRSCQFAEPVANAEWRCNRFNGILPKEFIPNGCDSWDGIK